MAALTPPAPSETELGADDLPTALLRTDGPVVWFPVRHHSPAAARIVVDLARAIAPAAILIEGPSDFDPKLAELDKDHELPIAIFSHVRTADGSRLGAYYPFCIYSPEWQAFRVAHELGAAVSFIDLPWADVASVGAASHRWADSEMRSSRFVAALCRRFGVEGYDELWDALFEMERDEDLDVATYLRRCHGLCWEARRRDPPSPSDARREAFMAARIRETLAAGPDGPVLVVTGGYHSSALLARLQDEDALEPARVTLRPPEEGEERGIALTPYSYERLDGLIGYDAGMPSPGFYDRAWRSASPTDDETSAPPLHRELLSSVAGVLREKGRPISAADLIAAETMIAGLATLRGHPRPWRRDLEDGVASALIKEERRPAGDGRDHPLIDAVRAVMRGAARGRLAPDAERPPLVADVNEALEAHDLAPGRAPRTVDLDLHRPEDRPRSRLLHRLAILEIVGFRRVGGTDLTSRRDGGRIVERWNIAWSPDLDASLIEASRWGSTLPGAVGARLADRASRIERDAEAAATLLLAAALAGIDGGAEGAGAAGPGVDPIAIGPVRDALLACIRDDGQFGRLAAALGHLLYLYRWDEVLGTAGGDEPGALLAETWTRCLWMLESVGAGETERRVVVGVQAILATFERAGEALALDADELVASCARVVAAAAATPLLRGACVGILWTIRRASPDAVIALLRELAGLPDRLGEALGGIFATAREAVRREAGLLEAIDGAIARWDDAQFLRALPAMRLAFTFFTPREKHHLVLTLRELDARRRRGDRAAPADEAASGDRTDEAPLAALVVSAEEAAASLAFEADLFAAAARFGIRGATEAEA